MQLIELVKEIPQGIEEKHFCEILRTSREKIGLMQYKAAEHMEMNVTRLKALETGYFRVMPAADELRNICEFYGLPYEVMLKKAETHVATRLREIGKNG